MKPAGADLRLAVPAAAAWVVCAVLLADPGRASRVALVAAVCTAAALLSLLSRRHRTTGAAIAVALAAAGLACTAMAVQLPTRHPDALSRLQGHTVTALATVIGGVRVSTPTSGLDRTPRYEFDVTVMRVAAGDLAVTGRVPALVFAAASGAHPELGSRLSMSGTFELQPAGAGTALYLYASSRRTLSRPPPWLAATNALRAGFTDASRALPGDGSELLPGLSIGDVSRVSGELDSAMKLSSLSHLTAVSGSNCAVIVGGMLALAAAVGLGRRLRLAAAAVALLGFVALVTPGASVLRAAVMACVVMLGTWLGRPARALPALSLAVLLLLAHDPWLARDYGFTLSVLATAGLLLLAPSLAKRMRRLLPRWLADGLSVPLAAQLACQPVLVLLNPAVPLYGVAANALAEPAAAPATVLGLLACLAEPFSPALAAPLMWLAWAPAEWIGGVARTTLRLPASQLPWPGGILGVAAAAAMLLIVALAAYAPPTATGRRVRVALAAACAGALVVTLSLQAGPAVATWASRPKDWIVGLCDIGQGDAIVLHDGTRYALIDTGPDPKPLAACLRTLGIRRLDLLVLTHYDLDHVGGLDAVAALTRTALVGHPSDATQQHRIDLLTHDGADVHLAERGDMGSLGSLRWKVLWPDDAHPDMATSNEGGVTLLVSGHGVRMIFLADLDQPAQDAVIDDGGVGPVDIVKVAHHGSADQSDRLYGILHARLGLISSGLGNSYGHPTAHLLDLLHAAGTLPVRTDLEGMCLVTARAGPGGAVLGLWTQKHATTTQLWTPARKS